MNTLTLLVSMGFEEKLKDMTQIQKMQRYRSLQVSPESNGQKKLQLLETQK